MDEELAEILNNAELDNNGKADAINKLVGGKYVPTTKYTELKSRSDTALSNLKSEYDTYKQSKMSDEEKAQAAQAEKDKAIENANKTISKLYAENIFKGEGLKEDDYSNFIDELSILGPEKSKELATSICNMIKSQKADAQQKLKDNILKGTPKPVAGNPGAESDDLTKIKTNLANARKEGNSAMVAHYLGEYQKKLQEQK